MNLTLQRFLKGRENKYPHNLESQFARIFGKIMELWGTAQLDPYLSELMIADKEGRQGFPPEVMSELISLSMLHDEYLARKIEDAGDIWANEGVRRGLEEEKIEYSPQGFFRALDIGNERAVQLFIDAGVDLEQKNAMGWTPLMVASFMGSENFATMLVNAVADANVRDNRGYSPLHWAAYQGFIKVTELLVKKGAFVNVKSEKGLTPLLQAAARGHTETVQFLLAHKAAVNEPDDEGWTPLHKAVANGHLEVVELLIAARADQRSQHESGMTSIDIARQKKNSEILQVLLAPQEGLS